jgi:hypothetical protein
MRDNSTQLGTEWQALAFSMLMPLLLACGFGYFALTPSWDESHDWIVGLVVLAAFEAVRTIVLRILRDTYADYRNPWHALGFFLLSLAILVAICLAFALFNLGIRDTVSALLDVQTWRAIALPTAVLVLDGVINVFFFRGNTAWQAARLDALADDAQDWISLAVYPTPIVVLLMYGLLLFLKTQNIFQMDWLPLPHEIAFRTFCFLYVACYFAGKTVLVANVYTARFKQSGKRLLSATWFQILIGRKSEDRGRDAKAEARSEEKRRSAFEKSMASPAKNGRHAASDQ